MQFTSCTFGFEEIFHRPVRFFNDYTQYKMDSFINNDYIHNKRFMVLLLTNIFSECKKQFSSMQLRLNFLFLSHTRDES